MNEEILHPASQKGIALNEYVAMDGPRQALRKAFQEFLTSFVQNDRSVYGDKIRKMCEGKRRNTSHVRLLPPSY